MQSLGGRVGTALAEMGNGQNSNAHPLGHLAQRIEHRSYLCIVMTVGLSEVGVDGVDDDQDYIAAFGNHFFQQG